MKNEVLSAKNSTFFMWNCATATDNIPLCCINNFFSFLEPFIVKLTGTFFTTWTFLDFQIGLRYTKSR